MNLRRYNIYLVGEVRARTGLIPDRN